METIQTFIVSVTHGSLTETKEMTATSRCGLTSGDVIRLTRARYPMATYVHAADITPFFLKNQAS